MVDLLLHCMTNGERSCNLILSILLCLPVTFFYGETYHEQKVIFKVNLLNALGTLW